MKPLLVLTDRVYSPDAPVSAFGRWLLRLAQDPRDLPFFYLIVQISLTLIPLAVLLFLPVLHGWAWGAVAGLYLFLNNITFKGPFGLMLHCACHRPIFKKQYRWLNHYLPWVIGPLFGQTPETYFTHHIGMHHAENNTETDTSSTMNYQRDSWRGFARYLGSFMVLGMKELVEYFLRTNKQRLAFRSLRGEVLFFALCVGLWLLNWPATLVVFVLPLLISRVIMMLGNWTQHAFVDAAAPGNAYTNSVTCINTRYNHKCWNDGYHIGHHVRPGLHWTEHPAFFQKNLDKYIQHDAIVFDGIHFLHLFAWLMTKRYDLMARHFVNLGNRYQSDEQVVALLKSRTRRIVPQPMVQAA
ncbi:fatty acid desaturase [Hymenobacter busanensis]|uniref:Fatty acid desaturase n=1 Tax=Hymenobacter busanensis TaxID=2607656 RepID=A0A7L5A1L1_9BACT|nr:fatty acid desaturase [Hymenobacter busanensis]KAA9338406.1 fatty acid desaturase [Hymenobacter busanensis]QHJ09167.1 fatty acid desaturase [Hymenobacter busanensis]